MRIRRPQWEVLVARSGQCVESPEYLADCPAPCEQEHERRRIDESPPAPLHSTHLRRSAGEQPEGHKQATKNNSQRVCSPASSTPRTEMPPVHQTVSTNDGESERSSKHNRRRLGHHQVLSVCAQQLVELDLPEAVVERIRMRLESIFGVHRIVTRNLANGDVA